MIFCHLKFPKKLYLPFSAILEVNNLKRLYVLFLRNLEDMPVIIDIRENALYKKAERETKHEVIVNLLQKDMSIKDIAEVANVTIDEVIAIKNELNENDD